MSNSQPEGFMEFSRLKSIGVVLLIPALALLHTPMLPAQALAGIAVKWRDNYKEWTIVATDETKGELQVRFHSNDDWSEWNYRLGEQVGQIRLKWRGNPNEWETRGENIIVSARTSFSNDFRQWRVSSGDVILRLRVVYNNSWEVWEMESDRHGRMDIYTAWERDFGEWEINDELSREVALPLRMTAIFLAIFHSFPKE
jgi:hypothetical protein